MMKTIVILLLTIGSVIAEECSSEHDKAFSIKGSVDVLEWTADGEFAREIATWDRPVVLRKLPAASLLLEKGIFEAAAIMTKMPGLLSVKRMERDGDPQFHFPTQQPMASVPEIFSAYWSHYSLWNMTARQFFEHIGVEGLPAVAHSEEHTTLGQEWQGRLIKCEQEIDKLGPEYAAARDAITPFIPKPSDPSQPVPNPLVYVWIGQAQSLTPCHLDHAYNFYLQLVGRKHFLLFPPSAHRQLYMRPSLHPAHRASQIPLDSFRPSHADDIAKFPLAHDIEAVEVTLQPGDVLFLPPMWFHHVTNREFTIAMNTWTTYEPTETSTHAMRALGLSTTLPFKTRVQTLRSFLLLLLAELRVGQADYQRQVQTQSAESQAKQTGPQEDRWALAWVRAVLLEGRYRHIPLLPLPSDHPLFAEYQLTEAASDNANSNSFSWSASSPFCRDPQLMATIMKDRLVLSVLKMALRSGSTAMKTVRQTAGDSRFEILLADVVEHVVNEHVGPGLVHLFLRDFVDC